MKMYKQEKHDTIKKKERALGFSNNLIYSD